MFSKSGEATRPSIYKVAEGNKNKKAEISEISDRIVVPKRFKNTWITITLINLFIVAVLGVLLRSKILFSIPGVDFKFILHAHSHFAFGGWITLCLFTLMTYEILPKNYSSKPKYQYLLSGILASSAGMLFSFPFQGYAFFSIMFSTLFVFVTYAYSWVFIKDLLKSKTEKTVSLLCIVSLIALILSSIGPFTLAYMMASHSLNTFLYKDAIYTYLHLQYNGFFTLGVFSLFVNQFNSRFNDLAKRNVKRFAVILSLSVLPTLFLSYLWHFQNIAVRSVAVIGCVLLAGGLHRFIIMMRSISHYLKPIAPFAKVVGLLSMIAFAIKTTVQIGIVFPSVGNEIFGDRPIIIGYLHLVMLGFVTLYLLAHFVHVKYFEINKSLSKTGIIIFICAVIGNELILMTQGLSAMVMSGSTLYPWLLWAAAIGLFIGALLISLSAIGHLKPKAAFSNTFSSNNSINFSKS